MFSRANKFSRRTHARTQNGFTVSHGLKKNNAETLASWRASVQSRPRRHCKNATPIIADVQLFGRYRARETRRGGDVEFLGSRLEPGTIVPTAYNPVLDIGHS